MTSVSEKEMTLVEAVGKMSLDAAQCPYCKFSVEEYGHDDWCPVPIVQRALAREATKKVETRWRVDYFNEVRCFWESYPGFFHKEDDAVSSMKVGILGYRSRLVRLDISTNETIISERIKEDNGA